MVANYKVRGALFWPFDEYSWHFILADFSELGCTGFDSYLWFMEFKATTTIEIQGTDKSCTDLMADMDELNRYFHVRFGQNWTNGRELWHSGRFEQVVKKLFHVSTCQQISLFNTIVFNRELRFMYNVVLSIWAYMYTKQNCNYTTLTWFLLCRWSSIYLTWITLHSL